MKSALAIKVLEEIAFVGLVPTKLVGRNRADIETVHVRRGQ